MVRSKTGSLKHLKQKQQNNRIAEQQNHRTHKRMQKNNTICMYIYKPSDLNYKMA